MNNIIKCIYLIRFNGFDSAASYLNRELKVKNKCLADTLRFLCKYENISDK